MLAAASLVLGLALCGVTLVRTPDAYWLVFGVIGGIGSHCTSSYAVFAVLAGRFRERPATVMAIADAGSSFATLLGLPIIHWIIVEFGWRAAYLILGSSVALIGGALHLLALDPVRRIQPQQSAGTSIKTPFFPFWRSRLPISAAPRLIRDLTQQIALLDRYSVGESLAVWVVAVAGLVLFVWRLWSGYLCDLWGPWKVMMIAAGGIIVTFTSLAVGTTLAVPSALLIFPLAVGIAFGGQQVVLAIGARLITTLASLASVLGICRMASGIGMAAGPLLAGYAYDVTGQYGLVIILLAVVSLGHVVGYLIAFGIAGATRSSVSFS